MEARHHLRFAKTILLVESNVLAFPCEANVQMMKESMPTRYITVQKFEMTIGHFLIDPQIAVL